jgi:hypothetical protein
MTAESIVDLLLENDEIDPSDIVDPKAFISKRPTPSEIAIYGRRWFRRTYGGTYFRVYIYVDGVCVHESPLHSGYGEHYLEVGTQWLEDEGYIPPRPSYSSGSREPAWSWIRDHLKIPFTYSAIDVKRQKDT